MSPSCPSRWRSSSSRAPGTPSSTAPSAPAAMPPGSSRSCSGSGTYMAVDRDESVTPFYERFAASASAATRFVGGDFALVLRNMASTGARAEAILMDLGTSSMQVDTAARGFSYASDAPLDMRMDASSPPHRRRDREHVGGARDRRDPVELRRGALRPPDRPRHRPPPRLPADRAQRRPRGAHPLGHPDAGALRPGPSGQASLPGASHRDERRAPVAARRPRSGAGRAHAGRPASRSSASTRSRTGSSSTSSATPRAAARARRTSPSASAATSRRCGP